MSLKEALEVQTELVTFDLDLFSAARAVFVAELYVVGDTVTVEIMTGMAGQNGQSIIWGVVDQADSASLVVAEGVLVVFDPAEALDDLTNLGTVF